MKIAIVSQYFPPDKPGRIVDELSAALSVRGHDVRVVTSFPHYSPVRGIDEPWRPQNVEERGGVSVKRVRLFAKHSRNPLGRILNYLSFAASALSASSFVKDADVVYVHGTPATAAYPAYVWSKRFGIPFLYHVQDIWPESVTGSGFLPSCMSGPVDRIITAWLSRIYRAAGAVVAISPSARKLFIERGAAEDRVHLVYNWAAPTKLEGTDADASDSTYGLELLYAGNLGPMQDLQTVIRAVGDLQDLAGLRLRIAGSGVSETDLRKLVIQLGLEDRVEFLGLVSREKVQELYRQSDFQIVPLRDLSIFSANIPSKFQAGLAAGIPIITTVAGDVSSLVVEHSLGFAAVPEDAGSLVASIREAYAKSPTERTELRRRAREFSVENLTMNTAVTQIEVILASLPLTASPESVFGARRAEGVTERSTKREKNNVT